MEAEGLKYVGAGLAAIGAIGAGIGVGNIFMAYLSGVARNPSVEQKLFKGAFIGAGMAEALGLGAIAVAMILLFSK